DDLKFIFRAGKKKHLASSAGSGARGSDWISPQPGLPGETDCAGSRLNCRLHAAAPDRPFPRSGRKLLGQTKSVGRIYQQTFVDTYAKVAFAKLYDRKNALVAADVLNDRVLPFFEEHGIPLLRVLTDRGTEFCGPQTNGICERFHRTIQEEFYATAFRKKLYTSLEELQADLDGWLDEYNRTRPHSGKYCYGKTPMQTFVDSLSLAREKMLDASYE